MTEIRSTPLGSVYRANCYVLTSRGESVVIDPGAEPAVALGLLEGLHVTMVLLTHCHCDHIGAALEVREATGAPIAIASPDVPGVADLHLSGFDEEGIDYRIRDVDLPLEDGDVVHFGDSRLRVLVTPGHTRGSACFLDGDGKFVLTGDTLFAQAIGRTDFPGGSVPSMVESCRRLMGLPDALEVMPGHGARTFLGVEKRRNRAFVHYATIEPGPVS